MTNDERLNAREELVQVYNKYIDEMAKDALEKKPVNENLVEMTNKVMARIRDWDIMIAMNKQKENSNDIEKTM